jgi:hypothetical protein
MAVISVTTLTVKPDKYEAFLDQNHKAKTISNVAEPRTSASWEPSSRGKRAAPSR